MLAICNGMARGGSTLLYNVARTLIEGAGAGSGHGFVTSAETHGCYCSPEQLSVWAASDEWHVAKTHEVLGGCAEYIEGDRSRVLYIYRDLRDVAVSMKRAFYIKGEDLLTAMGKAVRFYGMLNELREANPDAVLWLRYEDVYADLPAAIKVCADFLALDASQEQLEGAYGVCRIESKRPRRSRPTRAVLSPARYKRRGRNPPLRRPH